MPFFKPGTELYRRFYGEQTTVDPVQVPGAPTIEEPTGPVVSFPYIDPSAGLPFSPVDMGGGGWPGVIDTIGDIISPFMPQEPQGGAVPSIIPGQPPVYSVEVLPRGQACWTKPRKDGRVNSRARVKLQRFPDGSTHVVKYCAPRRMNPLNPRALGRAARRLGSFHRIAATVEKQIQRACKSGIGRRRSSGRLPASCAPRRCR